MSKVKLPQIQQNPVVPEVLQVNFTGLSDFTNQFDPTVTPLGSLQEATNCILERPGTLSSRRGYGIYGTAANGSPSQGLTFVPYNGSRLCWFDDNLWRQDNGNGQFTSISSTPYYAPGTYAGSRVRTSQSNGNLYYNSNTGVYKIQSTANAAPRLAGGPQALGGWGTANAAANNGPLPNSAAVAYRSLWEYTDLNGNLIRGVPSNPVIVSNSNTVANAQCTLTWQVPTTVDTSWNFKVYRSNYGAGIPPTPDDNCQLVYSIQPNTAQITARSISFTDNVADNQRGETIYTTVNGTAASEYRPPVCQDIALFKGCMFYVNTYTNQQLFVNMINDGVMTTGDTLKFYDTGTNTVMFTLTAGNTENVSNGMFNVFSGNGSSIDIDQTSQSLLKVCNWFANNSTIDAYYLSVINVSATGSMLFQRRDYSTHPFYIVYSNSGYVFEPPLPTTNASYANNTSSNTYAQNYVYFSQSLQPEAVPLDNYLAAGSSTTPILRVIPMRDTLVIFKSDGLYGITGNDPTTFAIYPMDVQQELVSINSPAVLNNYCYFVASQGVVQMDEYANHQIISTPIQRTLLQYTTNNYPNFQNTAWGMAYQADHSYQFWCPESPSDSSAQQAFVYNYITASWVNWEKSFTSGMYDPNTKTQWATSYQAANTQIYEERKTLTDSDYVDETYTLTITGYSGNSITVSSIPGNAQIGDAVYQYPYTGTITAINTGNNLITLNESYAWNVSASAVVAAPIPITITTCPIVGNDPMVQKQFSEYSIIVDGTSYAEFTLTFTTDTYTLGTSIVQTVPPSGGAYGVGVYGIGPYGTVSLNNPGSRLRNFMPRTVQKCNWLVGTINVAEAYSQINFSGLQLVYRPLTTRQRS
jgi:hypothetical protein